MTAITAEQPATTASAKASADGQRQPDYGVRAKTTWHLKPKNQLTVWEGIASIDRCPEDIYRKRYPDEKRTGPMPVQPVWRENAFILFVGSYAPAFHLVWNLLFPDRLLHWAPAVVIYHFCLVHFATILIRRLHTKMIAYGTFDEHNRGRDMVDDKHVNHLGRALFMYTALRNFQPFLACWRGDMANPFAGLSIYSPLKLIVWEIALDYWFYLYHRSTHEFDCLWWVHRQHHATKHPTPMLSILADDVQEIIEILVCPILASVCAPALTFTEFHYAMIYTLYVEVLGHSGIRAVWQHPILGHILKPFGMELAVEDHDLHHRFGRSGKNYGKQTRIWDRIFGTIGERIETPASGWF